MRLGIQKLAIAGLALGSTLLAQQRPPMGPQYWWESRMTLNSLNLTEAQTKQLNAIKSQFVDQLMSLRTSANTAENNLQELFNQSPSDQVRADAAIDSYATSRGELTRTLTRMEFQMRKVLTADQWQTLQELQKGPRPGGPGRGSRRGPPASTTTPPSKVAPAAPQK